MCYETGKSAQTFYEVLEYEENATRVKLSPITGRSHQLRVHMLALGHPILGDRFYAHPQARALAPRLQLHAQELFITHPAFHSPIHFECLADFNLSYDTKTVTELSEARSRQSANPITPTRTRTFDIDIVPFIRE